MKKPDHFNRRLSICLLAISCIFLPGLLIGQVVATNTPPGLEEFEAIKADNKGITVMLKGSGTRFNYKIDDSEIKIGSYGASVLIPFGSSATFTARHICIVFSPTNSSRQFHVRREIDMRSFGRKLSIEEFLLDATNTNSIVALPIKRREEN